MQKKSTRKLSLSKETLRALSPVHLGQVGGAGSTLCGTFTSNETATDTCIHCGTNLTTCQ